MRYSIKVEQKHIDAGRKGSAYDCPVARALKERFRIRAEVYGDKILLKKPKPVTMQDLMQGSGNQEGGMWGSIFGTSVKYDTFTFTAPSDAGTRIEPFSFEMEIPPEIL